jgi:hypothetical protein
MPTVKDNIPTSDNPIREFALNNTDNALHKWAHYLDIYHRYFQSFIGKPVNIIEIGVSHGGSLLMWQHYFGLQAKVYGIDINPECKQLEREGIEIFIGCQEDRAFLQQIKQQIPKVDIFIDDGGHFMQQQIVTFEEMYPHVQENGLYLIEDLHTSYWPAYGGGYKKPETFIEYSKNLIDYLNAWHSESDELRVNGFSKSAYAMHYYDSMLIIEKRPIDSPFTIMNGKNTISKSNTENV